MSRKEEVFIPALKGKKIPVISLDNKWYRLMNGLEKTPRMQKLEDELKELLKRQGKVNTETRALRKQKKLLMENIVDEMDGANAKKQNEYKKLIEECNHTLAEYQEEMKELPAQIDQVNFDLMIETMQVCYEAIQENSDKITEIAEWINNIRIELKKNVVRKQQYELQNHNVYSYMHDIFGAEVIDIFDMAYNPAEKTRQNKASKEEKKEENV
ncbi:MAG: hypothetical protein K2K96_11180 [Lachnospiraceae bacterium]|nr:hypothetical protein [Lachnospiraceae bacterium]